MSQQEKVFADGFSFKRGENAPEWVVGRLSIKADDAIAFIKNNVKNGWLNLNINYSKSGSAYVELDTFVPTGKSQSTPAAQPAPQASAPAPVAQPAVDEDLPF